MEYKKIIKSIRTELYKKQKTTTTAQNINKLIIELQNKYNIIANKEFLSFLIFDNNLYAKLLYERKQIYSFLNIVCDKSTDTDTENIYNNKKSEIMQIYAHIRIKQIKKTITNMKKDLHKDYFMYINLSNKINRIMRDINKINTNGLCEISAYNNKENMRHNHKTNNTYRQYDFIKYLDTINNNKMLCSLWIDNKLINKKAIHKKDIDVSELSNIDDEQIKDNMQFIKIEQEINQLFA